jgi:hypothetical protein
MTNTASHHLRELDQRCSDGIDVQLLWNARADRVLVAVSDLKTGEAFVLEVPERARALEVFHHPFAYAA